MRRFGLAAFLALTLVVGVVGVVAYNLGVSAGAADAAIAAGASVIYAPAAFSPFGVIIGGFFLILLIGFFARVIAGPRRHMGPGRRPMGPGGWGPPGRNHGEWDHETVPEPFRPMLTRWHRDAHAEPPAEAGADATGSTPAPRDNTTATGQPAA
jgi:hypothetical protein